ncbi:hypothetical protein DI09_54p10 [Mitosporidium daphniae]|uniref:Uncharacterized protein n=1 Tax=Mitosporidium daphniae TaxID=1485682 RepID=A0A098VPT3_9MICR|nr:uncharacterized protein DI09_54p10 [Mitosporidium daphniae]KGG50809.1 hypothetical protein DI09_54p10 [Mitosporidium daphniae]|eukprot:XP_013237254.1 uncharacterized protein DI09_54p10 [Mitosporidium daphniae]
MSSSASLEQVSKFIASDNMKDIIPKLVFLQKHKSLSEEFIENAKNLALKSLTGWITADQEARLSKIASLHLLLSSTKRSLSAGFENHQTNLITEALCGLEESISTADLTPPQCFQKKKEDLIRAVKRLSSTIVCMEDQVRQQRFYIPDRQILAHIKQIKSDILRRRRMTSLPRLVGL